MSEPKKQKLDVNQGAKGCHEFVERKKRWCSMTVAKGNLYCGEHSRDKVESANSGTGENVRIPCPLDPKHSVFANRLAKHLRICNAREQPLPDYIKKGINSGSCDEAVPETNPPVPTSRLNDLDIVYLKGLVDKVQHFYDAIEPEFAPQPEIEYFANAELQNELTNPNYGPDTLKHLTQTSALIGSMQRLDLLHADTCYIEFGAGRGQVSYYLANALKDSPGTSVLLIDRASMRHKMDNRCEDRSTVHRVRADIADLDLGAVYEVVDKSRIVGISKHLCGAATDLAIRCMTGARKTDQLQSLVIAVCCHHRCTWQSFVGKKEFLRHNLSALDFVYVIKMVGWAVCGGGMSKETRKKIEEGQDQVQEAVKWPWTHEEREEIGYKCKRIIDHSRLQYLRDEGYATGTFYYISKDVTLENLCIYAKTQPIS